MRNRRAEVLEINPPFEREGCSSGSESHACSFDSLNELFLDQRR